MNTANTDSPHVKTFSCPNCAGSVKIRAIGSSINVICNYCSSIIDTNDENYKVVETFTNTIQKRQVIELGQRGKLYNTLWENIGYMERTDQTGTYIWSEYLLFNPLKGFRWLTEYAGHWSFVTTTKDSPKLSPKDNPTEANYKNKKYQIFNRGTATVNFVIGEFYWQVRIGETVDLTEFICPPEIISIESNAEEVTWSVGLYTKDDDIKTAFQIDKPMPIQTGIAPNQPSPFEDGLLSKIGKSWMLFFGILVFMQLAFAIVNASLRETLFSGQFEITPSDTEKTKVTPQFEIKDTDTNLDFSFEMAVNNSWVEIGVDLVNDDTGETVEFEQGIEYYSGSDSDGAWSEGSTSTSEMITSVAKGKYHLNLDINPEKKTGILNVVVKTKATIWSNFFFAVVLLSVYPIFALWKKSKFDRSRWAESDFSPYYSSVDEEEDSE